MLEDIEKEIEKRLIAKWKKHGGGTDVHKFDVGADFEDVLKTPALSIVTENIGLRRITAMTFEIKPLISVYMCFKNVAKEKGRRFGIYPMVLGTIGILAGNDLGLEIDELMPVGSAQEIFHSSLKAKGMIGWKVSFSTSFDIDRLDDEDEVTKLIALGMSYYLPGDDAADANDEIVFQ